MAVGPENPVNDFNLDAEPAVPADIEEPLPALDELEINLDDLDPFEKAGQPAAAEAARPEDTPGAKFELDLDLETLAFESADAVRGAGSDADLSAFFKSVGTGGKESAAPSLGAMDDAELELDLTLNETASHQRPETSPSPASEDELDLSDLESMLEGVEKGVALKPAATEGIDLELDLQSVVAGEAPSDEMQELDLTGIADPAEKSAASVDAAAEELDFSGLAGILDEKAHAAGSADIKEAAEGIDLVFDEPPQAESVETESKAFSSIEEGLMLDLEKLLEEDEEKKPATPEIEAQATDEMDLRFATEPIRDSGGGLEIEIESVADSGDFAGGQPSAAATPAAVAAAAATGAASAAAMAAGSVKTAAASDDSTTVEFTPAGSATDVLETEARKTAAPAEQKAKAAERSGGIRKLLLAAAALVVLAIAALVVPRGLGIHLPFLRDMEIPFLGKIFQAEPEDTIGNLKITVVQESISAEFVENVRTGRICVIQGQVRNNYDHPRSFIRVTGKLYDKNKTVVKMTTAFAGNVLSKDELAGQGFGAISAQLKNRNGANNLNVGVKPGVSIPFMVEFDGLPENLDEFSAEAAGSSN
jgi:hypothetical protein